MKLSPAGVELLKGFEGCRLVPYDDADGKPLTWDGTWHRQDGSSPKGIPTNGIGHVIRFGDQPWMWGPITVAQAEDQLQTDVANTASYIARTLPVTLNAHQQDSCIALAFNIGAAGFGRSSLCAAINAGHFDVDTIRPLWIAWDHAGGKENAGLRMRRAKELALFCTPMPTDPIDPVQVMAVVDETANQLLGDLLTRETAPPPPRDTPTNPDIKPSA